MPSANREFGDQGELLAAGFLRQNGYSVIEQNFLVRSGEIDLIAEKDQELIFVEVKTRRNKAFGEIVEAVTPEKAEKLVLAIEDYFFRKNIPEETPWRLDLITVDCSQSLPKIEHFQNILE